MPRRRLEASLTAVATISSENGSSSSKATRTLRYSISSTPSGSGVTHLDRLGQRQPLVAAVEDVDDDPEHHPADADDERARVERHHDDPGGEGAEAAEHRGQRHLEAEGAEVERRLPGPLDVAIVAGAAGSPRRGRS